MYGKLINGNIEYAPSNFKLNDGSIIVNFNKSIDLMVDHGFKNVIDNKPTYDISIEYITISNISETEKNIIINYVIKKIEKIDKIQTPTYEERLKSVEEVILNIL